MLTDNGLKELSYPLFLNIQNLPKVDDKSNRVIACELLKKLIKTELLFFSRSADDNFEIMLMNYTR